MTSKVKAPAPSARAMNALEIYNEMFERLKNGARYAAMATIVTTKGSTPQRPGAKIVVFEDGSFIGTVGGGCIEADIYAECKEILRTGGGRMVQFSLSDDYEDEEGMVCGGQMEVIIERWPFEE